MLSGIGALIVMAQIYILFNLAMSSVGLENLVGLPNVFLDVATGNISQIQAHSGLIGAFVILILYLWRFGKELFF